MSEKRTKQWWLNRFDRALLIGIAVIFVLAGVLGLWRWWTHRDLDFDRDRWDASVRELDAPTTRQRMCDDILDNHLKVGMTELEVWDLLGPPGEDYPPEGIYYYQLGSEPGFLGMGLQFLHVSFDEDGRLVSARVITD